MKAPIVQATLGSCDGPLLAAAVSRAGALGCLTVHNTPESILRRQLNWIRSRTPRPVLVSFTRQWQRESVHQLCLSQGFRHFQVFWWNGPRLCPLIHAEGGMVFWQVGTREQAQEALGAGADALVAQGTEAGGQVRTSLPLVELVAELRDLTQDNVPIIAGGGLADRRDVEWVLSLGVSAALLGTRFLLSEEAHADSASKRRLLRAHASELWLDPRMIGEWPCAPRRRLITFTGGDQSSYFAGLGLSRMRSLLPAAEIVRRLTPSSKSQSLR